MKSHIYKYMHLCMLSISTYITLWLLFCGCSLDASENFVVVLVDARRLNYSSTQSLLQSLARQRSSCGIVGHAWIYLEGKGVRLEGGHSGEAGRLQPKYFDGVMNLLEAGKDPNPIKYLWETQRDGYFEEGPGGHVPTYAIKIPLTDEQFDQAVVFVKNYPYNNYSLVHHQCCSFASQVAAIGGVNLKYRISFGIDPVTHFEGYRLQLWKDPKYSLITIGSPDILEQSMMKTVNEGKAQPFLNDWLASHSVQGYPSRPPYSASRYPHIKLLP